MERVLAKVVTIDEVHKHPNADSLDICTIGGWEVVAKIGEYKPNDVAIYCEVDSWIPKEVAGFLFKGRSYNGVEGERLRTIKLRGSLSQGLLLPLSILHDLAFDFVDDEGEAVYTPADYKDFEVVGSDVTDFLGIQKWEKPLPACLGGLAKGNFPSFIPKTDQERVQNLSRTLEKYWGEVFEATLKLDGSSCTIYFDDHHGSGVCSRNLNLVESEGNAFWQAARKYEIIEKLIDYNIRTGHNLAVQGEVIAPNIQGNYEKVQELEFYAFDVYDITAQRYLLPEERRWVLEHLNIPQVPVFEWKWALDDTWNVAQILEIAEGNGMNKGVSREGLVFKHHKSDFSFKAISNAYLLKADKAD